MPVYHALIEHGDFERVLVCNAGHVKNVPGRKTDLSDAEWLVRLLECGLLRGSFIPPADVKAARDVIRYRTKLTESRTSELQRLGNVLQDAGIKIDSVASKLATQSARAMVEALIDGERRPAVLADLAKGRMRAKIPDLARALEGRFGDHHALMCRLHLEHLDHLEDRYTAAGSVGQQARLCVGARATLGGRGVVQQVRHMENHAARICAARGSNICIGCAMKTFERARGGRGIVKLFGNACGAVDVSGPAGKRWWLTASFKPLRR